MAKRFERSASVKLATWMAVVPAVLAAAASASPASTDPAPPDVAQDEGWSAYGADAGGSRFAAFTQITRETVSQLEQAWTYRTGELGQKFARADKLSFEATPIFVRDTLYLSTPTNIVIALDPATGRERWRFDPRIPRATRYSEATSRGVSSWIDTQAVPNSPCSHRIFVGTLDARLIALDGATGQPCVQFAGSGAIDLAQQVRLRDRADYLVTSPPAIYRDVVIVGSAIGDNRAAELERGVVRAFDARTGALRWSWDPLPTTDSDARARGWDPAAAQRTGAANAWSTFSVDAGRGLVFIPTGSASPDFFGGERLGDNSYANSLVALRADTGQIAWHQQLVHHDVWDYDLAAQPMLIEIDRRRRAGNEDRNAVRIRSRDR
jgi:quinoprotein glucose dehydrogenase